MIEPIPYFYDSINRNAIVVKPKQPLIDWINAIYPENPVNGEQEATVYLVKEKGSLEGMEKWLKRNFDKIFINEMNEWHTDENDWVQKRTYKLFTEWFDIEMLSMVLDLEETVIIKN